MIGPLVCEITFSKSRFCLLFFLAEKYGTWSTMHRILLKSGWHGDVVKEHQLDNIKCKNESSLVTWARDLETPSKDDHEFKTSQGFLERQTALV